MVIGKETSGQEQRLKERGSSVASSIVASRTKTTIKVNCDPNSMSLPKSNKKTNYFSKNKICLSTSFWPRAIRTLWTFLGVTQVRITSSLTGTSLQTVSTALLGVTGTALGYCGVITSTCGVKASICGMTSTTSMLTLNKVSMSIVGRSWKDKLSDDTILSGTENCKKDREKID